MLKETGVFCWHEAALKRATAALLLQPMHRGRLGPFLRPDRLRSQRYGVQPANCESSVLCWPISQCRGAASAAQKFPSPQSSRQAQWHANPLCDSACSETACKRFMIYASKKPNRPAQWSACCHPRCLLPNCKGFCAAAFRQNHTLRSDRNISNFRSYRMGHRRTTPFVFHTPNQQLRKYFQKGLWRHERMVLGHLYVHRKS